MWENMKFKSDKPAGSILAAYFVLTVGVVGCSTVALFLFADRPQVAWYVLGGFSLLALLSLLLRRQDLPSAMLMGIFGSRRPELSDDYLPRRRPKSLEYGTNRPPTAEDIREAADGPNNWVPSGTLSGRRSVRKH